jgi:hypothetical protein
VSAVTVVIVVVVVIGVVTGGVVAGLRWLVRQGRRTGSF